MARGERAAKLSNASADYGGRRAGNRGWVKHPSRRAHAQALSTKKETRRAERRAQWRAVAASEGGVA